MCQPTRYTLAGTCISESITAAIAALCEELLKSQRHSFIDSAAPIERPHFDWTTGELTFRGELIREYVKRANNCRAVLAAFEESGWPLCIDDPLLGGKDADRLNNTVRSLNNGLRGIQFHAAGDGKSIRWKTHN
jgi:hypothetical protein